MYQYYECRTAHLIHFRIQSLNTYGNEKRKIEKNCVAFMQLLMKSWHTFRSCTLGT